MQAHPRGLIATNLPKRLAQIQHFSFNGFAIVEGGAVFSINAIGAGVLRDY